MSLQLHFGLDVSKRFSKVCALSQHLRNKWIWSSTFWFVHFFAFRSAKFWRATTQWFIRTDPTALDMIYPSALSPSSVRQLLTDLTGSIHRIFSTVMKLFIYPAGSHLYKDSAWRPLPCRRTQQAPSQAAAIDLAFCAHCKSCWPSQGC